MAYAPTITPFTDAAPCPRAEVVFTSLPPSATTVTVWRSTGLRKFRVRGAVNAAVSGGFTRMDTEIPFGVTVTYWADMFDVTGAPLGATDSTNTVCHCYEMWIHNPLDPQNAIRADFRDNALRELSRPSEGSVFYPQGRRVGVVVSGQRRGLSGVVLDIIVDTVEAADKFAVMTGGYESDTVPVLCFRKGGSDQIRIPSPLFVAVMDPQEVDVNYVLGGSQIAYAMRGDEVSPPAEGIVVPLLTRADIAAYYQSRQDVADDNTTRLSVARRYDLAGSA